MGPSNNTIGPNGSLIPYTAADAYNYGALNFFQRPDERYTAGAFLHYDFNDHVTVYANTMFMQDTSLAQIAASGAFFSNSTSIARIPSSRAAMKSRLGAAPATRRRDHINLYIGRRNVEGGGRVQDIQHTDWHVVLGAKGKIDDAWDYDVSWQYSIVNLISQALKLFLYRENRQCAECHPTGANAGEPTCVVAAGVTRLGALRALQHFLARPGHPGGARLPGGSRAVERGKSPRRS